MVGVQPNAPAAFAPGGIPGTHFHRLSRPQGTWLCSANHVPVTPMEIDPGTVRFNQSIKKYINTGKIKSETINMKFCTAVCSLTAALIWQLQNTCDTLSYKQINDGRIKICCLDNLHK